MDTTPLNVKPVQRWALAVAAVALAASLVGGWFAPTEFFASYLIAYLSLLALALGSMAVWMIHNLTGGKWGFAIRRPLEAAVRTLPAFAAGFLPIAAGLPYLYVWARPGASEGPWKMHGNTAYLNVPFFLVRAGTYFAAWLMMGLCLSRWSAQYDHTGDKRLREKSRALSAPGLVVLGFTVSFAAVDWLMSLEPAWFSTIFGLLVASGQTLPALAFAVATTSLLANHPSLRNYLNEQIWNDLGNLLLMFVMLWAYMSFSQFLLMWCGNLPEEIEWYLKRTRGGWQGVAATLALGYFALPFALLLFKSVKRVPGWLRCVALLLIALSILQHFWLVAPVFAPENLYLHWLNIAMLIGVGGLWLAYYAHLLQSRPLLPRNEPLIEEVLNHARTENA